MCLQIVKIALLLTKVLLFPVDFSIIETTELPALFIRNGQSVEANWAMRSNDNSGQDNSVVVISEDEFDSIRNKYVPISISLTSVSEYPFQ